jgi:hypothetical protein
MLADTLRQKDAFRKRPHLALNLLMARCASSRSEPAEFSFSDGKLRLNL